MVTGRTITARLVNAEQRAALVDADMPLHWPSLIAVAVLAVLASACWPWGFAQ